MEMILSSGIAKDFLIELRQLFCKRWDECEERWTDSFDCSAVTRWFIEITECLVGTRSKRELIGIGK